MPASTDSVFSASRRKVKPRKAQAAISRYSKVKHRKDGY